MSIDRQKEPLQDLCDKFEDVVFEPLHTDEAEINAYVSGLFSDQGEAGHKLLADIRDRITYGESEMFSGKSPFGVAMLDWVIKGLLAEDLLSDEKQSLLRDLLGNEVVLREIADVLNMRIADLDNWQWEVGELGIPVLPRQQLNGKYRIWMEENIIQAMLIHYTGIRCCVFTRAALLEFELGSNATLGRLQALRASQYQEEFLLSQLPEDVRSIGSYENDESSGHHSQPRVNQGHIKQKLLRTLASEVIVQGALEGEVTVLQSDLQWYGALPHYHFRRDALLRIF